MKLMLSNDVKDHGARVLLSNSMRVDLFVWFRFPLFFSLFSFAFLLRIYPIFNRESHLEKNCLFEKILRFCLKNFSLWWHRKFGGLLHSLFAMPLYKWRYRYINVTTISSIWRLRDVTDITFCRGNKSTPVCILKVAMVTYLKCNLTYTSRSMAYIVCHAPLEF